MKASVLVAALGFACVQAHGFDARGADLLRPSWYFTAFHGKAQLFLGSEDPRTSSGLAIGFGREEARLRFRSTPAQLVVEAYFSDSYSRGASGVGPNRTTSFGALGISRYYWRKGGTPLYLDVGFGAQYATMRTVDLESRFNTTPMIGLGASFPGRGYDVLVGLRLLHISNGGTSGDNQGQNQLLLTVAYRF